MKTPMDLEKIYLHFREKISEFILRRVRDEQTADDIVHDVFLKIHSNINTLRDQSRLESWIYQIARNAITDHFRQRKNILLDHMEVPDDSSYNDDESFRKVAESIEPMLGLLPDQYREALELTEFRGLTQKELAEKLGISLSGAKSRVQRGRSMLKNEMLKCCHFEFDRFGKIIDYYPVAYPCCEEER
jgi:RNA polymerase sigma-70 factor, ECF subfamily